jgi:hypothetical protein
VRPGKPALRELGGIEVSERGTLGRHEPWRPVGIDTRGWDEPIADPVASDLPPIVVHEHVVMSTQKYSAFEIGLAVVSMPVVNMVCFAPTGRSVASGEQASAVSGRKRDTLAGGEEALFAADVEGIAR